MIWSVGEVGLQKNLTPEESRNGIASMLEEVDRLASLVDALLMITRPDAGNVPVQRAALRVMEVAREGGESICRSHRRKIVAIGSRGG
jgi:K+-sensing histidine kinase KdpD